MNLLRLFIAMMLEAISTSQNEEVIKAFLELPFDEIQKHRDYDGPLDHLSLREAGLYSEMTSSALERVNKTAIANLVYLAEHAESQADREQAYRVYFQILNHYSK